MYHACPISALVYFKMEIGASHFFKPCYAFRMSKRTGWFIAIATYVIYSSNSPLAKAVFNAGMSPATLLSGRFLFGSLLFLLTLLLTPLGRPRNGERPLDRNGVRYAALCGFLNGLALLCFFYSFDYLQASTASVLAIGLYLVYTLTLLLFWGERLTAVKLLRLALGLGGAFLLVNPSSGAVINPVGVYLILVGSFAFSLQMVLFQQYLKPFNIWQITAYQVLIPAVMVVCFWFFLGVRSGTFDLFVPGALGWVTIVVLGLFSTFIGRWLTFKAMSVIGSGEMALLSPLETALVLVWSFLFLGEWLTPFQWLGAFLVIIGVLLGQLLNNRSNRLQLARATVTKN